MQLLQVFALSGLINGLIALFFGIFVISHNWRDKLNRLYFLIIVAVDVWSFSYWRWLSSGSEMSALFWVRMLSIGSTFIPIFYFHWVTSLLDIDAIQKKAVKILVKIAYTLGILFIIFSFSNLFISGVEKKLYFPYWPNPGALYHIYLFLVYISLVAYAVYLLIKNYKKSDGEYKKRIEYVLLGTVIAFGGGLSNFFLWYNVPIPPFGNFLVALFPFLFGYATIRYRLFNIKVIATELFVILIWIFLFIKILLSTSINDLILNAIIFVAVFFAGILLVNSVSKEVKQREQIEEMAKQMQKAYEVEKKAREELESLDKAKNQFLMAIQHHLRTPLTAIKWNVDLIVDGSCGRQNKQTKEVVKKIDDSIERLIKMVNEFLDVTQFQLGKEVVSLSADVKLKDILNEIVDELKIEADKKGIYLKMEKASVLDVSADFQKLKAAIYNIIDNAIKYTKKGGVQVETEARGGKALIIVKDTGIGIKKEEQVKLFDHTFERGEQAKKTFITGRGIGLYIASQIVKAHKGRIWAESEGEGKGSTFYIELPLQEKNKRYKISRN